MTRIWTAGAMDRIPLQSRAISVLQLAPMVAAAQILAPPGSGFFVAVMALTICGSRNFFLRQTIAAVPMLGGETAPWPEQDILTLANAREPWSILTENSGLEIVNAHPGANGDYAGIITFKILDEPEGS